MSKVESYTLDELAAAAGVTVGTLRAWSQRRIFATPPFRGPQTRYERRHRLEVIAIRRLREKNCALDEIADWLRRADEKELEGLAGEVPLEPAVVEEKK